MSHPAARHPSPLVLDDVQVLRSSECRAAEPVLAGHVPGGLRLLPMIATHLSYPEIAEQLSVSRSTVKVQGTIDLP